MSLFDGKSIFDTPKPVTLLQRCIHIANCENEIVLDFFAGASPMAEAVYLSNMSGNRIRFIQVQLPEKTSEESEAKKNGFSTIADIAKERIRRAGVKIRTDAESRLDLENNQNMDFGFKVLKLDQSNFKHWQAPATDIPDETLIQQMELNVDHIDPNASREDLLYELLLKAGIMPTETVEIIEVAGQPVYAIAERTLLVHLENTIDQAVIDAVLDLAPQQFICLDKAFHGNDQLKANAVKTFANFNQGKEGLDRIEFKTV